jgi:hypothetical protein
MKAHCRKLEKNYKNNLPLKSEIITINNFLFICTGNIYIYIYTHIFLKVRLYFVCNFITYTFLSLIYFKYWFMSMLMAAYYSTKMSPSEDEKIYQETLIISLS